MISACLVAFAIRQSGQFPQVFETPLNGGEAMQVMLLDREHHATKLVNGQYPSISVDGKMFAYSDTKWMPEDSVIPGLYTKLQVANTTGHLNPRALATYKGAVAVSMPMFSSDGTKICYEVTTQRPNLTDPQVGIYLVSVKGGKSTLLYKPTVRPAQMCWPVWNGDGKSVVLIDGEDIVWVDVATKKVTKKPARYLIGGFADNFRLFMVRPSPKVKDAYVFTLKSKPGQPFDERTSHIYVGRPGGKPVVASSEGTAWHPRWESDAVHIEFYRVGADQNIASLYRYNIATRETSTLWP